MTPDAKTSRGSSTAARCCGRSTNCKQQLQNVWSKRGGDAESLLRDFKQWCIDAEATGIQALRDFVKDLKSYTVPKLARA